MVARLAALSLDDRRFECRRLDPGNRGRRQFCRDGACGLECRRLGQPRLRDEACDHPLRHRRCRIDERRAQSKRTVVVLIMKRHNKPGKPEELLGHVGFVGEGQVGRSGRRIGAPDLAVPHVVSVRLTISRLRRFLGALGARRSEENDDAPRVGHRSVGPAVGEQIVGQLHARIELFTEFVARRGGCRVAARPEELDEGVGLGVGLHCLPGRLLFGRHEVLRRPFRPIRFSRRGRGKTTCGRGCNEDDSNQQVASFHQFLRVINRPVETSQNRTYSPRAGPSSPSNFSISS